ncbi:TolB family protein, partial [Micromonospora sp. ATA51]|uniref:TolB family protein n=1 Tax=Micromonospora sp. ATA51 TaxID=2806098 RepID=UPI001EE3BCDE
MAGQRRGRVPDRAGPHHAEAAVLPGRRRHRLARRPVRGLPQQLLHPRPAAPGRRGALGPGHRGDPAAGGGGGGVYWESPTWSPDGTQLALVRNHDTLVTVDVATGAIRVLVQGHYMVRPNWSRDGSMIVTRWHSRSEGPQLKTLTLATGKLRRIYLPEAAGENFDWPVFMPNSERVVFCTNRWTRDTDVPSGAALASVRIDGTGLKRLTDTPRLYLSPVFSPDGRYCAALSVPPTNEYPDGGNIIVSTSGFGEPWWIPGDEYDDSSRLDWRAPSDLIHLDARPA